MNVKLPVALKDGNIYKEAICDDCGKPYLKWHNKIYMGQGRTAQERTRILSAKGYVVVTFTEFDARNVCECEREDKEES